MHSSSSKLASSTAQHTHRDRSSPSVPLLLLQAASGKGIMCSYNAVNGEPSCASSSLLKGLLRDGLGFDGYVVSDCNAVAALTWGHRTAGSYAEAAAASVKAGVDMLCDKPDLVSCARKDRDCLIRGTSMLLLVACAGGHPVVDPSNAEPALH